MTVTVTTSRADYTGDGAQTVYNVPFQYFDQTHVVVIVDGTTLVLGTDYLLSGDKSEPDSTCTFTVAPADGAAITILRRTPSTQLTEYTPYGPYKAEQIEADLDKAILIDQEHDDDLVNKADINHNHDDLYYRKTESDAKYHPLGSYALTSTRILTGDAETLSISNPTLGDDVLLTPRTNISNGLAKLDANGFIPQGLLPPSSNTFLGGYDASGNVTPPAANDGEYYIIAAAGNIVCTKDGVTIISQPVAVNDKIVWDQQLDGGNGAWWLFGAAISSINASSVIYDNVGSGLTAVNAQDAIDELQANKAPDTHFEAQGLAAALKHNGVNVGVTGTEGLLIGNLLAATRALMEVRNSEGGTRLVADDGAASLDLTDNLGALVRTLISWANDGTMTHDGPSNFLGNLFIRGALTQINASTASSLSRLLRQSEGGIRETVDNDGWTLALEDGAGANARTAITADRAGTVLIRHPDSDLDSFRAADGNGRAIRAELAHKAGVWLEAGSGAWRRFDFAGNLTVNDTAAQSLGRATGTASQTVTLEDGSLNPGEVFKIVNSSGFPLTLNLDTGVTGVWFTGDGGDSRTGTSFTLNAGAVLYITGITSVAYELESNGLT